MGGIDRRLVVEIVTLHGIPIAQASAIVRYVLEQAVQDLRRCEAALRDEEWRMGVRIAAGRLEWAGERSRATSATR